MKTSATLNQKITAAQIWFNTARETANLIHADILAECAVIRAAAGNPRRLSGGALQLVPQSLRVAHTAAKATECAAQKKLDHLLGVAKRFA